jgi:prephenate dehydrogenase
MKFNKIVIIGTGLIGGSLGKAILKRKLAKKVVGVCRRESTLKRTLKEKAFSEVYVNNYEDAAKGADIIFIATPVHTIKKVLNILGDRIKNPHTIVTDVGSTKKEIVEYASKFKNIFSFVGGHPLAGSEQTGIEHSTPELFKGSCCILTKTRSTKPGDLKKLKELWGELGASVGIVSPEKHDENLAFSSHLPHVIASALSGLMWGKFPYTMFSTGFEDTTRIASSDAYLWKDIFFSNKKNVLSAIKNFKEYLTIIEKDIRSNDEGSLIRDLNKGKETRERIQKELKKMRTGSKR